MKDQKDNNADLFSQPPLLIFIRVPILVEGTVYIYIYIFFFFFFCGGEL